MGNDKVIDLHYRKRMTQEVRDAFTDNIEEKLSCALSFAHSLADLYLSMLESIYVVIEDFSSDADITPVDIESTFEEWTMTNDENRFITALTSPTGIPYCIFGDRSEKYVYTILVSAKDMTLDIFHEGIDQMNVSIGVIRVDVTDGTCMTFSDGEWEVFEDKITFDDEDEDDYPDYIYPLLTEKQTEIINKKDIESDLLVSLIHIKNREIDDEDEFQGLTDKEVDAAFKKYRSLIERLRKTPCGFGVYRGQLIIKRPDRIGYFIAVYDDGYEVFQAITKIDMDYLFNEDEQYDFFDLPEYVKSVGTIKNLDDINELISGNSVPLGIIVIPINLKKSFCLPIEALESDTIDPLLKHLNLSKEETINIRSFLTWMKEVFDEYGQE